MPPPPPAKVLSAHRRFPGRAPPFSALLPRVSPATRPPRWSSNVPGTLVPQGLHTGCSLCQRGCALVASWLPPFQASAQCHLIREAGPGKDSNLPPAIGPPRGPWWRKCSSTPSFIVRLSPNRVAAPQGQRSILSILEQRPMRDRPSGTKRASTTEPTTF